MDHLRLQSAFKFVAISRFGDGGQLMPRSSRGAARQDLPPPPFSTHVLVAFRLNAPLSSLDP